MGDQEELKKGFLAVGEIASDEEIAATERRREEEKHDDDRIKIMNFHSFVGTVRACIPNHPSNIGISEDALNETVRRLKEHLAALRNGMKVE